MTERALQRQTNGLWLACLAALTLLRLILAGTLPVAPDEAYYWLWSRHLQAGYYDHPPMVAFFIRAGTLIFGHTALGVRLLGPLSAAAGSWLLWRAAEDFWPGRHAGLIAAGLFNATLLAGTGAVLITPDTPLLLFWTAALAILGRLLSGRDRRWWLGLGAAGGAALLSKYTGGLLIAAVGLWLLSSREGRRQLGSPWPWAGLALAVLIFAPNLAWNATHGWVSYIKQGSRIAAFAPARALRFLAELLLGQIGLATPLVFGLMAAGVWRMARLHSPSAQALLWITLLPAGVFLEHGMFDRVQANWPAIIYPGACIAASGLPGILLARWLKPALGLGFAMTLGVYLQSIAAVFPLPPARDPIALQLAGWERFSVMLGARHAAFVTADDYATAAELAFHASRGETVAAFGRRWRYLDLPGTQPLGGKSGVLVTRRANAACPAQLGSLTRLSPHGPVMRYRLCQVPAMPDGRLLP